MSEIVRLPKFGLTMEEASISEWSVEVGEAISKGQVLAIIESEKVEMELPSPASGIVAKHLVAPGATVAVGEEVAIIAADNEDLTRLEDDQDR
jgi:pyruvate/2-oxoglutarate dehydrogenase complex dihydrolipoamide acyltransferase (E2) component